MGRATWGKADRLVGGFKMFQALLFSNFGRVEATSLFEQIWNIGLNVDVHEPM